MERLIEMKKAEKKGKLKPAQLLNPAYKRRQSLVDKPAYVPASAHAKASTTGAPGGKHSDSDRATAGAGGAKAAAKAGVQEQEQEAPPATDSDTEGEGEDDDDHEGELLLDGVKTVFATARFGASSVRLGRYAKRGYAKCVLAQPLLADSELLNASSLKGHVAVVKRGACSFVEK